MPCHAPPAKGINGVRNGPEGIVVLALSAAILWSGIATIAVSVGSHRLAVETISGPIPEGPDILRLVVLSVNWICAGGLSDDEAELRDDFGDRSRCANLPPISRRTDVRC